MSNKSDFIRDIIDADLEAGRHDKVHTRFPPEPNGYLHIGHAKSICLNFGLAEQYRGKCNLRFDDTNPAKEDQEYVDSIAADIRWLGFDYGSEPLFASDYFDKMYEAAVDLIKRGLAYVCSLNDEEIREYRGTLKTPGKPSPYRDRSVEENLDLFAKMRAGEFPNGAHVLRARIDMAASNMKLRDPLLYRIRHDEHHRTGNSWPIYPMYDFAHPIEDALECITHSICTLEFENNRDIYDWVIENCDLPSSPKQYEFARLAIDHTVMSKRKLLQLVEQGHVSGWDDPRMPTLAGMRRRGYRPEAIRRFCDMVGVAKNNSLVDIGKLEFAVRDDLNSEAPRVMAVLAPLRVVITNGESLPKSVTAADYPPDIGKPGERALSFSDELYIEADDFQEMPEKGFRRLAPGRWIRLRYAWCIRCDEVIKDTSGNITELRCSAVEEPEGEKVWGVIHWVDAKSAVPAEVRLYDRLFSVERPDRGDDFLQYMNENSLEKVQAFVEAGLAKRPAETRYQFERQGYFVADSKDSRADALVYNRIIGLRDSWANKTKTAEQSSDSKTEEEVQKSDRANSRPKGKSKAEYRALARERNPVLAERYQRYQELGIPTGDADLLSGSEEWGERLDALVEAGMNASDAAQWLVNEHPREDDNPLPFAAEASQFVRLLEVVGTDVSTASARTLWKELAEKGGKTDALIDSMGLRMVSDDTALEGMINEVLAANPDKLGAYRGGKTGLLGFFVGQVVRASKGSADAGKVKELLAKRLDESE